MKSRLFLVSLVLIVLFQSARSQSKKELESSLAKMMVSKDSIQKQYTSLSATYDSINKAYLVYDKMAKSIKEKIIHADFKPENASKIIDSLYLDRDSVAKKIKAGIAALRDSVKIVNRISDSLRNEITNLAFVVNKYVGKGTLPPTAKELTGAWAMNLRWYELASDSLQSGIILKPAPADYSPVTKIIFIDFEFAQLNFSSGDSIKCFYKINSFAADKPFTIDFTRENKVNILLHVNPIDGELYASYRKGKGYFYGFLRKM
ncbi:MAG: hypothetical protein WCI71_06945 [Bacteroidota bacterium]